MQKGAETAHADTAISEFRRRFPLGSTNKVVLVDAGERYCGMVDTAKAFDPALDPDENISSLADLQEAALQPQFDVRAVIEIFDLTEADYLAVVDNERQVLGTLSEQFVHRRYADEVEKAQRELFGE